jgi:hypothetical protein
LGRTASGLSPISRALGKPHQNANLRVVLRVVTQAILVAATGRRSSRELAK